MSVPKPSEATLIERFRHYHYQKRKYCLVPVLKITLALTVSVCVNLSVADCLPIVSPRAGDLGKRRLASSHVILGDCYLYYIYV